MYIKNSSTNMKLTKIYKIVTLFLVAIYGLVMLFFCLHIEAMVPDEAWFYSYAKEIDTSNIKSLIVTPNYLGYGSFYWIILAILHKFVYMRMLAWVCLVIVPICIIYTLKRIGGFSWGKALLSILLFLSMPMAWFTGKIIGPELIGNAFGTAGATLILCHDKPLSCDENGSRNSNRINAFQVVGGVLTGASAGIKVYNIVFLLFALLYVIFPDAVHRKIKEIFQINNILIGLVAIAGFIITNGYLIYDMPGYFSNIVLAHQHISFRGIVYLFSRRYIEWDLVNSGGICSCIISAFGLGAIIGLGLFLPENRRIVVASVLSIIALLIVFSTNERVLGWYFIPMLYFVPLCINQKAIYIGIIILNMVFMHKDVSYQIVSKIDQIEDVAAEESTLAFINSEYKGMEGYETYYYYDVCLDDLPFSSITGYVPEDKQFIVISDRARANEQINNLYLLAERKSDGYYIKSYQGNTSIIIHK